MPVEIPDGGSKLDRLLAALAEALAAIDPAAYQHDDTDAFHEAAVAFTDAEDEADDSSHLAFSLVVGDSPAEAFDRHAPGHDVQFASAVSATLCYRLRDGEDGNTDGRLIHRALLDMIRVVVNVEGWTNDPTTSIVIGNRGRNLGRAGSWLRYQILFTLQYQEIM